MITRAVEIYSLRGGSERFARQAKADLRAVVEVGEDLHEEFRWKSFDGDTMFARCDVLVRLDREYIWRARGSHQTSKLEAFTVCVCRWRDHELGCWWDWV